MKKSVLKLIERVLRLILLVGLILYYPGKLIYNFITGYLAVFIAKIETFEGVTGIKELVIIDGVAAIFLGGLSILSAWLLIKRDINSKLLIFSFLFLTLIYYLAEPLWFRLAGFPVEVLNGRFYEKPLDLLRPIGAALMFCIYFYITGIIKIAANKQL